MEVRIFSSQSRVCRFISRVREALVTSVTWTPPSGPPVGSQITQLSMVPKRISPRSARSRRPSTLSSSQRIFGPKRSTRPAAARSRGGSGPGRRLLAELLAEGVGTGVLPDQGVVDGLAGRLVPQQGWSHADWLIADRLDVGRGDTALATALSTTSWTLVQISRRRRARPPAGLREDLLVLLLVDGDDPAVLVEDDAAAGGGALVDRGDERAQARGRKCQRV